MRDGYQSQVGPSRTAEAAGQASAADFGGEIFDAMSRAGSDMGARVIRETKLEAQREYQREAADAMVAYAKLKENIDLFDNEARSNTNPGAAGHRSTITKHVDDGAAEFLGNIKNEKLRKAYEGRIAEWRGGQVVKADAFERIETIKLIADNSDKATDMISNRLSRGASEKDYAAAEVELREGIADLEGIPDAVKRAMEAEGVEKIAVSWLSGQEPEAGKALLAGGFFDGKISPEALDRLDRNADTEIRRKQIEAEARARAEKADAREAIDQFQRELNDGVPKSDTEIEAMQALAGQYGLQGDQYDLGKARVVGEANRRYKTATPVQLDAAVKSLSAKISKAGDKAKPADIVLRDHLSGMLSKRTALVEKDPLGFAAELGMTVEPIDFNDPASVRKRRRVAEATAKSLGVPAVYLGDEEKALLQANMTTPSGRKEAAQAVMQFGGLAARRAAMEIAPSDKGFQYAVGLPAQYQDMIFAGQKMRSSSGGFKVPNTESLERHRELSSSINGMHPDFRTGVLEATRSIYAYHAAQDGNEDFDEELWDRSFNMALGGTADGKRGGVTTWNGNRFLLPEGVTASGFGRAIANGPTAKKAYTSQGQKIPLKGLTRSFFPVSIGAGVYHFQDRRGGVIVDKKGSPLRFQVRDIRK